MRATRSRENAQNARIAELEARLSALEKRNGSQTASAPSRELAKPAIETKTGNVRSGGFGERFRNITNMYLK